MVFYWSLRDSKSPEVSRTLLSILADLDNAEVWMFSTSLLISKSSTLYPNPLMNVPSAPITIGITVTFKFCCFLDLYQGLGIYLSFHFPSVLPSVLLLLLLLTITRSGRLGRLDDPFVFQNLKEFSASHFLGRIQGWAYNICSYGQI